MKNYFSLSMRPQDIGQISALGLAHCGDAVFELLVRSWLCDSGKLTTTQLHRATVSYVCAPAQAARVDRMLPLLTKAEFDQWRALVEELSRIFGQLKDDSLQESLQAMRTINHILERFPSSSTAEKEV